MSVDINKKLIVGNWKMNGSLDDAKGLIADTINGIFRMPFLTETCDFVVCPPFMHIYAVRHALTGNDSLTFGAQNCSRTTNGAHTGDISAEMLRDSRCTHVIVGHSERRERHGETDEVVREKASAAISQGIIPIICIGESAEDREAGRQEEIVGAQLEASLPEGASAENTVIAYEPVWAIGTGKTASPEDVRAMHAFIRGKLKERLENSQNLRILYGGSMKPDNAKELLATENVDGGLIGGASLNAEQFLAIGQAALA